MRLAFLFPGLGSQRPGMARAWRDTPQARVFTDVGHAAGLDLATLADDADRCGSASAVGQPAILAASLAALDALVAVGVRPDVVAGYGLGEVTAAVAAGALSANDGATFVAERGRAMGAAIDRAAGIPGELRDGVLASDVDGAVHSSAMTSAVVRVDTALRRLPVHEPTTTLLSGSTGQVLPSAAAVSRVLVEGILAPVRWRQVQEQLPELAVELIVEVGPGGVLADLARRRLPGLRVLTVERPDDVPAVVAAVALATPPRRGPTTSRRARPTPASTPRPAEVHP